MKENLSTKDIRLVESVAGTWLQKLNYQRACSSAHASAIEKDWYSFDEYFRQLHHK